MVDRDVLNLYARSIAQDMLLRGFYAAWAVGQADPEAFLFTQIEGMIGSLDAATERQGFPANLREPVEANLRQFLANVRVRLSTTKRTGEPRV